MYGLTSITISTQDCLSQVFDAQEIGSIVLAHPFRPDHVRALQNDIY